MDDIKEKIIEILKQKHAASEKDMVDYLDGMRRSEINKHMMELVIDKKIDFLRLSALSHAHRKRRQKSVGFLIPYSNKRLYFLNEDEFKKWVIERIPADLSGKEQQFVSMILKSYGIIINIEEEIRKYDGTLKKNVYNLKERIVRKLRCPLITGESEVYFNDCKKCDFYVSNITCVSREYNTNLVLFDSETENDEYGGMPSGTYTYKIKCADCDGILTFTSGLSSMTNGMSGNCPKCGLYHRFIKNNYKTKGEGSLCFAVPRKGDDT